MNKKITPISTHDRWDELGYVRRKFDKVLAELNKLDQPILEKNAKKIRKLPVRFRVIL
jgi:hypothetical protein